MSEKINKVPTKIATYNEGDMPNVVLDENGVTYEPRKGEIVEVFYWVRYPTYDFIFGVPHQSNPNYGSEVGFFQYRNTKRKKVMMGVYVDCAELEELYLGFMRINEISKVMRPDLWKKHYENIEQHKSKVKVETV